MIKIETAKVQNDTLIIQQRNICIYPIESVPRLSAIWSVISEGRKHKECYYHFIADFKSLNV